MSEHERTAPDPSRLHEGALDAGIAAGYGQESEALSAQRRGFGDSILAHLAQLGGPAAARQLREATLHSDAQSAALRAHTAKYQLLGEIARGGIGVVHKGRDRDLGREVAIKVLREPFRDDPALVQRFVTEAQIGGRLQHPGIVPIYDVGLQDGCPFISMKLIEGRTLAALLQERSGPEHDRHRFLTIFAQVCQTMAYAHARGVIHRDLKPANVMVGAFGEVQVVDWGMAKVLPRGRSGGTADVSAAFDATVIDDGDEVAFGGRMAGCHDAAVPAASTAGAVLGTPAYMPPEQANGEVDRMDERSDVFGLGAILCEILTGTPPYVGPREQLLAMAAAGDLDGTRQRLRHARLEPELAALTHACLQPAAARRPRNAEEVAANIGSYLAQVEQRAQEAVVTAARQRAETEAAKRAQRLTLALAVSLLLTILCGGGAYLYVQDRQHARSATVERQVEEVLAEATRLRGQAEAATGDLAAWTSARRQAEAALALVTAEDADVALRARVASFVADLRAGETAAHADAAQRAKDAAMVARLETIPLPVADFDDRTTFEAKEAQRRDTAYATAFAGYGINMTAEERAITERIAATAIAEPLALALDDWCMVRSRCGDHEGARRLRRIARTADPDPWRNRVRDCMLEPPNDAGELRRLAAAVDPAAEAPASLVLLGRVLIRSHAHEVAARMLESAQIRHPADFQIAFELGRASTRREPPNWPSAVRAFTAAVALRPQNVEALHQLGIALTEAGDCDAALAIFRDPPPSDTNGHWLVHLGELLQRHAHDLPGAIAAYRQALALRADADASYLLGSALIQTGERQAGIKALREAVALRPDHVRAHGELGRALAAAADGHGALGAFQEWARLAPEDADAHSSVGGALHMLGRLDEAITAHRRALQACPGHAVSHYNLGMCLAQKGDVDGAEREYRLALATRPDFAKAWCNLGSVLAKKRWFAESLEAYERGHAAAAKEPNWPFPSADWAAKARTLAVAERPLLAIVRGMASAVDAEQALAAAACAEHRSSWPRAVELYVFALGAPAPASAAGAERLDSRRQNAARAACRAAAEMAAPEDPVRLGGQAPVAQRAAWRQQARQLLRLELSACATAVATVEPRAAQVLASWQHDPAFAAIRDPAALAAMSEAERDECAAFWRDVQSVLLRLR